MSISAITIEQDNVIGGANLLAAQSPLSFIANVNYDGLTPDRVNVELRNINGDVLDTYAAIPYRDTLDTQRQFIFLADQPVRALLGTFDEFVQGLNTLQYVNGLTKQMYIRFVDLGNASVYGEVLIDFAHVAKQFGESPCLEALFNNETDVYFTEKNGFVYLYFYNDNEANEVGVDIPPVADNLALDFDDTIFADFDDTEFSILSL